MENKNIIKKNEELISMDDRYYVTHPKNTWDTNYHLVDTREGIEYLIDIGDIINGDNLEEGLVYWEDIVNLTNIEELKLSSWKTKKILYNPYMSII